MNYTEVNVEKELVRLDAAYEWNKILLQKTAEISDFMKDSIGMLSDPDVNGYSYYSIGYLYFSVQESKTLDIESFVENISPLWLKYQIPWRFIPEQDRICFRIKVEDVSISCEFILAADNEACRLVKVARRILSEEEIESYRVQYDYKFVCGEE